MDFANYRKVAIRYWELRRIVWNIILIPPALFGFMMAAGVAAGIGDPKQFGDPYVIGLFCFSAVGANICYSFAYVVEFWMAGRDAEDGYCSIGRHLLFALGCLIGIGLALIGGQDIALFQYPI